ncbi:MAG: TIGR02099 family protein [Candidatus Accumulibacter sp.]|jgi:uncharacterized protein (TIGR02099 family)|nr:TIGR02099 family protein [Accumulibacter sp.]
MTMTRGSGLRAAFHRCAGLPLPFIGNPMARRLARILARTLWAVYFLFILLILSLRHVILPHIENYRPAIERMVGDGIGRKVSIGRIEAGWTGLHPDLTLRDVSVADAQGRPALSFSRVRTVLSWWSVVKMRPRLRLLRIDEPTLRMRRGGDGRFFVAGIPLAGEDGGGAGASWVLAPRRIHVAGATLIWEDETREAPALVLEDVHILLDNRGRRHRFGLTARPPGGLASRVDVRGDFTGGDFDSLDAWQGQAFAEIAYVDLAVWKRWVDYPIALPRGRGAARAWLSFAGGRLRDLTADVVLRGADVQFGGTLPALNLESLSGRFQASLPGDGFIVKGREVALRSRADGGDAIRIDPTDFEFGWKRGDGPGASAGSAEISRLDVGALIRLSAHLPFDAGLRQWFGDFAPRGQISAFSTRWSGGAGKVDAYSLKTEVRDLGVRAQGVFPGLSGITGTLEASETGGKALLRSGASAIDLPAVFPESPIRFDSLNAQASWKIDRGGLTIDLARADFAGPEAAGSAKGTYRATGDGPGVIDMSAALERADARAVWRYLPRVVSRGARHWLRDSLLAGKSTGARLILKGDLKDFPFLDERLGQFLVTVEARGAILDYGKGWPRIEDLSGDLRFEGSGMTIEARQGRILGARLTDTQARIPDFDVPVPILQIKGQVDGPTAEFLKFIDRSPVAGAIDHFTEGMSAVGNGHLDLDLAIPLDEDRLGETRVAGVYRLMNNEVTVDAALPPLRGVDGSIRFSGDDLSVPAISASLFGGPLKIRGGSQKGGGVLITADGLADVDPLRRQSGHPLLDRLSGAAPYRAQVRIVGRNAELRVESSLVGLASTLPEPFAKTAGETLPLRFEKRLLPADDAARTGTPPRDRISLSLEKRLEARIIRRKTSDGFAPERGAIAIGRPLRVPETGLTLDLSVGRLDFDLWRALFDAASFGETGGAAPMRLPDTVNLRADELLARGTSWNDVDLSAALSPAQWKIRVDSRQMKGDIIWKGAGDGQLLARLSRLNVERLPSDSGTDASEPAYRLPALDVIADDFTLRRLDFGRLRVRASNGDAGWNLDRIEASNPRGTLTGQGTWRRGGGGAGQTQLSFRLDSDDLGGLLARMDYPGAVQGGTAQLEGKLTWNGTPAEIDYASMRGDLSLDAAKGRFLKLDPGAAGKLLGLISLQNLPRRISFDFSDVFSEGLIFDAITGKMTVQNGIMRTRELRIDSPSARVLMRGEVDLAHETQRLDVTVQPQIGDTAAVGIAIAYPAAGLATWLANRVLRNPLGMVFGYDYRITGRWNDPKIEKLNALAREAPAPVENP